MKIKTMIMISFLMLALFGCETEKQKVGQYKVTFYFNRSHAAASCPSKFYINDKYYFTIKPGNDNSIYLFDGTYKLTTTDCRDKKNDNSIIFDVDGKDTYLKLFPTIEGRVMEFPKN